MSAWRVNKSQVTSQNRPAVHVKDSLTTNVISLLGATVQTLFTLVGLLAEQKLCYKPFSGLRSKFWSQMIKLTFNCLDLGSVF